MFDLSDPVNLTFESVKREKIRFLALPNTRIIRMPVEINDLFAFTV